MNGLDGGRAVSFKENIDRVIGNAMFKMFSTDGYDVDTKFIKIFKFLTINDASFIAAASGILPALVQESFDLYLNNKDEVMKWQI